MAAFRHLQERAMGLDKYRSDVNKQVRAEWEKKFGRPISRIEQESGILAPQYQSPVDPVTGKLKEQFTFDPMKSEAFAKIREQAFGAGPSTWAQVALDKQGIEELGARERAQKEMMQAQAQQQADLMRLGGISGGARERMASRGARDLMMRQQELGREGQLARLGITERDEGARREDLKGVAELEKAAQAQGIEALQKDLENRAKFDAEKYAQQMQTWGAGKTAEAQERAARAQKRGKK